MEKERLIWIDLLNIVSCAGVLLLHCTNEEVHHFSGMPSANWFIGLTTHSFFLWPVNVFFMISGFTLIRPSLLVNNIKMKGMKNFYSRRLKRLGIPLLVWNMLYMVKYLVTSYHQGEEIETDTGTNRKICVVRLQRLHVVFCSIDNNLSLVSILSRVYTQF